MPTKFFITVFLVMTSGAIARADDFDEILPAPEILLKSVLSFGGQNDADIFGSLRGLCSANSIGSQTTVNGRKVGPSYCILPRLATEYKRLAKKVFANEGEVELNDQLNRLSPWDIRELIAGNFMALPDRSGEVGASAGLQNVTSLFSLRIEIAFELRKMQSAAKGEPGYRDVRQVVLVPSLQAYIQSSSPLGAMMRVYSAMNCRDKERLCTEMKSRMGSAIDAASLPYTDKIREIQGRLVSATDAYAPERHRKLRDVLSFATWLSDAERTGTSVSRDEIQTRLSRLIDGGQGAFGDEPYQNAARAVIVLVEANSLIQHYDDYVRDRTALTTESRERVSRVLGPLVKESVDAIDRAFRVLGLANEIGGDL